MSQQSYSAIDNMEDLTPQPSTRPWWSMLNFNNCCRPEDDTEDDDKNCTYSTKQSATTLKVITSGIITDDGKVNIETPMTACSDGSSGEFIYDGCL